MPHDQDPLLLEDVRLKVEKAYAAWLKYRTYTQEQIDAIVEAAAAVGRAHAQRLAELAVEETGYGNVKDKIIKNLLNADLLPRKMRGMKTVGVLRELPDERIVEIGVPMGVVAAILPTTNPTSTAIYKILISLKAGNAIVLSPHPRARRCTCETADLLYQAAVKAGAPEDIIQCVNGATMEATQALMKHRRVAVILATGGSGMVRAAYSSGKPAFGVGPGNVPVLIDRTANISEAVREVVAGKSFDYGTVCSSEQCLVAEQALRATILNELKARKAHLCDAGQCQALAKLLVTPEFRINPECVGQSPLKIARMAGFEVPPDTSILACEISGIGKEYPLSMEKLSPVLALLFVNDFPAALDGCEAILAFGGLGHTCVIFSKDESRIREFGMRMPAMRVLVNTQAPGGSTGITTNVFPSMTLGCGAMAGNATSDNVGPQHLINIKRIAYAVRTPEEALEIPPYVAKVPVPAFAPAGVTIDRQTVVAAVENYLAQRGIAMKSSSAAAPPAASAEVTSAVVGNIAAQVVERFLASKGLNPGASLEASPSCSCATSHAAASVVESGRQGGPAATAPEAAPKPVEKVPVPELVPVGFVCEAEVRLAMQGKMKIHVGPRTIITPSARDLGVQHDIFTGTLR